MSTEIKNTLFRFVTMRSPELPEETNKDKRFVYRGAGINGAFDTAVANRGNKTKWQAMKGVSFTPATETAIKDSVNAKLYDLAVWIAKNKYSYVESEVKNKLAELPQNLTIDAPLLWNNLFYQVITQKDFYAKEIIMQLLVAFNLYKNYEEGNTGLTKFLMNAKVVLPKTLFVEESASGGTSMARMAVEALATGDEPIMTLPSAEMEQYQAVSLANINIERHKTLKKELEKVEGSYKKEYQKNYDRAQASYQDEIRPILEEHQRAVQEANMRWCSVRDPQIPYDPADPCNQPPVVPEPRLPRFEFEFRNEIDLEFLQGKLSEGAFETLLDVLEIEREPIQQRDGKVAARTLSPLAYETSSLSFQNVFTMIDGGISNNTQNLIANTPNQGNISVSIGGVVVPATNTGTIALPFNYQACPKTYSGTTGVSFVNFDVSFSVPDSSWQVVGVESTVEKHSGEKIKKTTFVQNRVLNRITLTNLHHDALNLGDFYYTMKNFSVLITFSNGAKKSFTTNFWNSLNCATGRLLAVLEPIQEVPTIPNIPGVPATGADTTFVPSGFGVKQLGIADYKKVQQTIHGYVEGEVAAIENIMAREYKEKATRRLRRSENTTSTTIENEKELLSDTTATSRFDMQSEVAKVLQESKDFSAGATFGAEWSVPSGASFNLGANVNMATHSSKEESTRQAVNQAKEVTERAMERIITKVKEERIEKIIEEFEENNKHGFDNTKGDKHVVGVYRWVDKIFKNQIFNYGKRMMFEFMIPEPAKLHLLGMAENPIGTKLVEPVDPRKYTDPTGTLVPLKLKDYSSINDATVKYWGGMYNVKLEPAPVETMTVGKSFAFTTPESMGAEWEESGSGSENITLPEGYYATHAKVGAYVSNEPGVGFKAIAGGKLMNITNTGSSNEESISKFVGAVPVSFSSLGYHAGSVNFEIKLSVLPETKLKWQQETFQAIIKAYEDAKTDYDQKMAEENAKGGNIKEANPGFYRQIENMVLRKNCISYIVDQTPTAKRTYGKDMSKSLAAGVRRNFGNHEIKVDANLDDYSAFVKFIEQAFEWDIMSYNFYPYYWGARENWANLYQYDNNDPLFRSFMQAGMARVIVTVRPGFEEAVSYYMQTGQIWNGGEVPVIEDKLFLSIVDELRQPEGQKEGKAWATRIPTSLTILQADSIGLKVDKALPYDEDLSDFEDPTSVPHSPNFHITGAQMNGSTSKTVTFSYEDMDSYGDENIGYYDSNSGFPRTFRCMGQEIIIQRDAAWQPTDSPIVIYKKLAEQLSLISGIEAQQYTSVGGNVASIRFTVDTNAIPTFTFEKETPYGPVMPELDLVKILFTADSVRFVNPTTYTDRLLDANGTELTSAEINTLLPISRFSI